MSVDSDISFSIVMPTFRRPDALRAAVLAVSAQEFPSERFELIVVDDEGEGGAADVLATLDTGDLRFTLHSQTRRGAAAARNLGASHASGAVLLFVDDDIVVAADHLRRHAESFPADGRTLVDGAWVFAPAVERQLKLTPFGRFRLDLERQFQERAMGRSLEDGLVEMDMLGSWDLAVGRELFERLGGFDEEFPVAGAEDQDFSIRAREAGARLLLDTKIVCLHNDNRLDLVSYCAREERSASTMPFIARKHPREFAQSDYITQNTPPRRDDKPALIVKKLAKAVLASRPVLQLLHRVTGFAEDHGAPEPALRRLYTALLGLHLYRGFRSTYGQ